MTEPSLPLTSLSEAQRTQALERFVLLRPAMEGSVSQMQLAHEHHISLSTVQRWIKQYREKGLAGLANAGRSDKDKSRRQPEQAVQLIEGLALQTPPRSGLTVSLKEIEKARSERRKQVKAGPTTCAAVVEQFIAIHQEEPPPPPKQAPEPASVGERPRLKRYFLAVSPPTHLARS